MNEFNLQQQTKNKPQNITKNKPQNITKKKQKKEEFSKPEVVKNN